MPRFRSLASFAFLLVFAVAAADAAEFACPLEPARLPHESWGSVRDASNDELYRRIREGLSHWSKDAQLRLAIGASLDELLLREPDNARGYVETVRLIMDSGTIDNFTLSELAYDLAAEGLERAIALDPESAQAWALEGLFRLYRRGYVTEFGNGKQPEVAMDTAERLAPEDPEVMLAWARYLAARLRYAQAEERIDQILTDNGLSDTIEASAYRLRADYQAHLNRPGAAIRSAETAVELEPANPANWLMLSALVLEQRADTRRAIEAAQTALCHEESVEASRRLAYALYVDWAKDNSGRVQANMADERVVAAFERHPNVANVMGYMAEHREIAQFVDAFVIAGLSPDITDPHDDLLILYDAVKDGRVDDAERLIELGADVDSIDERYGSLIMVASLNRDRRMVRMLISHGADVNDNTSPAGTALIGSIMTGAIDMAQLLLEAGADPEIANEHGETALVFAATAHDDRETPSRMVQLLLDAGANPDVDLRPGIALNDYLIDGRYRGMAEQVLEALRERARRP